jgi:hypothetical protein
MCLVQEMELIFASVCAVELHHAHVDCTANRVRIAMKGETTIRLWR